MKKTIGKTVKNKVGRPSMAVKKVIYPLMLDPRYIAYFKKHADKVGVSHQDLGRFALNQLVPDPYSPLSVDVAALALQRLRK